MIKSIINFFKKENKKEKVKRLIEEFYGVNFSTVKKIDVIEVSSTSLIVRIHSSFPGLLIGKKGEYVRKLNQYILNSFKKRTALNLEIYSTKTNSCL